MPPAIVGKLVLTPADEMAWLTPDDLLSMNVTITDALHWPGAAARPTPFEAAVKPDGLSWPEYVAEAFERSYDRFGPGNFREICDVYRFVCVRYFYHVDKHGLVTRVTTFEDMSGNVVRREVCKFNRSRTIRACFDWDTLEKSHAAIGADGRWKTVALAGPRQLTPFEATAEPKGLSYLRCDPHNLLCSHSLLLRRPRHSHSREKFRRHVRQGPSTESLQVRHGARRLCRLRHAREVSCRDRGRRPVEAGHRRIAR